MKTLHTKMETEQSMTTSQSSLTNNYYVVVPNCFAKLSVRELLYISKEIKKKRTCIQFLLIIKINISIGKSLTHHFNTQKKIIKYG